MLHSQGGMVSTKIGKDLTILLDTGVTIKLKIKNTSLRLGDRVHVSYNHETSIIKEIIAEGATYTTPKAIEVLPWEDYPSPDDSFMGELEKECSRGQKGERLEGSDFSRHNAKRSINILF